MVGGVICTLEAPADAARVAAAAADFAAQLGLRLVVADAGTPGNHDRSEAFLEGVAQAAHLHGAELHVEFGERVTAVLDLAEREQAELLVVGRAGTAWREIVGRARCPVLVIPDEPEPQGAPAEAAQGTLKNS